MCSDQTTRLAAGALLLCVAVTCLCAAQKAPAKKPPAPKRAPAAPEAPAPPEKPAIDCGADLGSLELRLRAVAAAANPPAHLLLTDASGDKAGVDVAGKKFTDILDSSYEQEPAPGEATAAAAAKAMVLKIACQPDAGDYTLDVIGTAAGEYELEMHAVDVRGEPMDAKPPSIRATITTGAVHHYDLTYPARPGEPLLLVRRAAPTSGK